MSTTTTTTTAQKELWGHPVGLYVLFLRKCGNGFLIMGCAPF